MLQLSEKTSRFDFFIFSGPDSSLTGKNWEGEEKIVFLLTK